jgi:hypothetical protein
MSTSDSVKGMGWGFSVVVDIFFFLVGGELILILVYFSCRRTLW